MMSLKVLFIVQRQVFEGLESKLQRSLYVPHSEFPPVVAWPVECLIPAGWEECESVRLHEVEPTNPTHPVSFAAPLEECGEVALEKITDEYRDAVNQHGPFHSAHEALAVIHEEYLELEKAVLWKRKDRSDEEWLDCMEKEATQLGAMALRFLVDVRKQTPGRG
jgi:hypothetical protein